MTTIRRSVVAIDQLHKELCHLREIIGEVRGQMSSEQALFGDSWAGSQEQLNRLLRREGDLHLRLKSAERAPLNATREQWAKTWRTARTLANQRRDLSSYPPESLLWHAFIIATETRHMPLPTTARQRLYWKRDDLPF